MVAVKQLRSGIDHFHEKLREPVSIFFILMIHGISQFTNYFPTLRRLKHTEFFHKGEYGTEAINFDFFFDGNCPHGLAKMFLKLTEPNPKSCKYFVLFQTQCTPIRNRKNLLASLNGVGKVFTHPLQMSELPDYQEQMPGHNLTPCFFAI